MDFDTYQEKAGEFAKYPGRGARKSILGLAYTALGVAGESGEVAEKIKKVIRDQEGSFTATDRAALCKELGDVLWYVAACAYEADLSLSEVADANLAKLASRKERGTLSGSGDDR